MQPDDLLDVLVNSFNPALNLFSLEVLPLLLPLSDKLIVNLLVLELFVHQHKDLQKAVNKQAQAVQKASTEFLQRGGIQLGLSSLMKNPIPRGIVTLRGLKLGHAPAPIRV